MCLKVRDPSEVVVRTIYTIVPTRETMSLSLCAAILFVGFLLYAGGRSTCRRTRIGPPLDVGFFVGSGIGQLGMFLLEMCIEPMTILITRVETLAVLAVILSNGSKPRPFGRHRCPRSSSTDKFSCAFLYHLNVVSVVCPIVKASLDAAKCFVARLAGEPMIRLPFIEFDVEALRVVQPPAVVSMIKLDRAGHGLWVSSRAESLFHSPERALSSLRVICSSSSDAHNGTYFSRCSILSVQSF